MTQVDSAARPTSQRGWLVQYLVQGDDCLWHGRMYWWFRAARGELPDDPIPQIAWRDVGDRAVRPELKEMSAHFERQYKGGPPLSADGARKHLEWLISRMGGGWEALLYLVRWLAWGLAVNHEDGRPRAYGGATEEWDEILYRDFHLGRLQAADADVLGFLLSKHRGKGWNPHAYFPTSMNVCQCMAQIVMHDVDGKLDDGRDARMASVFDPCVGTGRMLLAASNFSVNLYGMDIDPTMVDACAVNLALYAPWGVYMTSAHREVLGRPWPSIAADQRAIEAMDEERQSRGRPPLPCEHVQMDGVTADGEPLTTNGEVFKVYTFDRHGHGDLFSVPPKEER